MNVKGFDENLRCRGMQFEVGKEYSTGAEHISEYDLCSNKVIHFCKSLQKVHLYYPCNNSNRFCEIEVLGEEVTDGDKCGTNRIKIIREINGEELDIMLGKINENTGLFNSGFGNSGDWNSGDWNSGFGNSGNKNSGNKNSGNKNSGNKNSGNKNSGNWNSGNKNSGNWNSGFGNSGNKNSGDWNSGDWNSGFGNSGFGNSGFGNSGNKNSGDWNSGFGNSCNFSNGVFCSESDMNIRIFNRPSGMSLKDWYESEYYKACISVPFKLTELVEYTDDKKSIIEKHFITHTWEEAWESWWTKLSKKAKKTIQKIPNFNAEIFKEITGIDVESEDKND